MAILAFDMGGTAVKYGVWSDGELMAQSNFPTPDTWEQLQAKLIEVKNTLRNEFTLTGVGISAPGSVDTEKGEIGGISAIPYIHHFPIQLAFEELLELPVTIENDANCAALAEIWQGAAKGKKDILFVVIGTGIGGAVIVDGKLHKGKHLYGGEFGIMVLDDGRSFSDLGTAANMAKRYSEHKGSIFTGKEVFDLAEKGETDAVEAVHEFYHYLSLGLFNLQFTLDPEMIVIGGGISEKEELFKEINQRIQTRFEEKELKDFLPVIVPCTHKNDANLVGAVAVFKEKHPAIG
ncbi:ROK family protein [Carnobacterium maltaromaticum]|jgi:predicted NBD/HSP70 family sugar kinase|uniref:ROK family protein n=2 Tax=Carnobacterium maltaromaticum TaxID=2751 RepID=K8EKR2_CARML|nr:ROK family protein [Carnobacterium maltaromaticum]AOA03024.1 N-acetylmannosamine kinase [Carnobacterium maltaromaticum]KRN60883.1 ROK family protein [Carnobacterium maltaromaticum DSM 20342]MCI1818232.1 ROK family protein [Carnobacterium maltaromaticum]CCO12443.2 ROK family protein [Carnobacterium maltaromaticum LMA28]